MEEFFSSFLRRAGMPASAGLSCMSMLSCYSHSTVWAGTKIFAPNKITYRCTAVIDVLQNAAYLEKQQHVVLKTQLATAFYRTLRRC